MRTLSCLFSLALILIATPALARNQAGDIHLGTFAGQYSPQNDVVNELGSNVSARMQESLGYGGQLTIWLNSNVALAASAFYVDTALEAVAFGETGEIDVSMFMGGGRVVVGIGGGDSSPSILNLSAGLVANQTDYGPAIESSGHAAGVIGLDLNIPVGPGVGFHLGIDDYIYDRWFDVGGVTTEAARQHDVVLFGGITFYTGR